MLQYPAGSLGGPMSVAVSLENPMCGQYPAGSLAGAVSTEVSLEDQCLRQYCAGSLGNICCSISRRLNFSCGIMQAFQAMSAAASIEELGAGAISYRLFSGSLQYPAGCNGPNVRCNTLHGSLPHSSVPHPSPNSPPPHQTSCAHPSGLWIFVRPCPLPFNRPGQRAALANKTSEKRFGPRISFVSFQGTTTTFTLERASFADLTPTNGFPCVHNHYFTSLYNCDTCKGGLVVFLTCGSIVFCQNETQVKGDDFYCIWCS